MHGLGILITAKEMATSVFQKVERSLVGLERSTENAAKRIGSAWAAHAVGQRVLSSQMAFIGGMFQAAEGAGKLEAALAQLGWTANANQQEFKAMREKAIDLGLTTSFSAEQAVEGMQELATAGMNATQSINTVKTALQLAAASGGEMKIGQAGEFLGQMSKMYPQESIDQIANVAALVAKDSAVHWNKLPGIFARSFRGSMMEQGLATQAAALTLLKNVNPSHEMSSTMLGEIERSFTEKKKADLFTRTTGVQVFDREKNAYRDLLDIFLDLGNSPFWNGMKDEKGGVFSKVFGGRQMAGIKVLVDSLKNGVEGANGSVVKGTAAVEALRKKWGEVDPNLLSDRAKEAESTFIGLMSKLGNKVSTIVEHQFGDALIRVFKPIVDALGDGLLWIGKAIETIPQGTRVAIAGGILLGSLVLAAVTGVGVLAAGWAMFGTIAAAAWSAALGPMTIAAGIIAGLAVLGVTLFAGWKNNIGGGATFITDLLGKAQLALQAFMQLFQEGGTWGDVDKKLMASENSGVLVFVKQVWMWFGRLKNFARGLWDGFVEGLQKFGMLSSIIEGFKVFFALLGLTDTGAKENAASFEKWGAIGRRVGEAFAFLSSVLLTGFRVALAAVNTAVMAFQAAWFLVGPVVKDVFDIVLDVWDLFVSIFQGDWTKFWHSLVNVVWDLLALLMNSIGGVLKFALSGVDAIGSAFGANWNMAGDFDKSLKDGVLSIKAAKFNDAPPKKMEEKGMPAVGALKAQVATATPAVTPEQQSLVIQSTPVILSVDGQAIASAVIKHQQGVDNRSFRPGPGVNTGLER
jgi:TP901 family phage tail tape measure protein